jgi:ribulose kinase
MRIIMPRFRNAVLLGTALLASIAMAPTALRAQEHMTARTYHDKQHNDDHEWNNHEDQAYRKWAKESHRKYGEFSKLKDDDQQSYWGWRHEHSDAQLKIRIR